MTLRVWGHSHPRFLEGSIFRQNAVVNKADHLVLGILVKFLWQSPDFPIHSNGIKPGTLQHRV